MKAGGSAFIWCRISVTPIIEDGKPVRMVGVITDITDLKEKTESLRRAVNLDSFTGLYNKDHTIALINNILDMGTHVKHALVILDIDNFKKFNDTYGHDQGDKIIKALSQKLKNTFRKTDIVGRFGGDEFIVFIQNIEDDQWLRDKLHHLIRFEAGTFTCTSSMGVSVFPLDAANFEMLFKKADIALYHAKSAKEKAVFFSALDRNEKKDSLR